MAYTSLHSIKEDFNIDTDDVDVIRSLINQVRVQLHPDKNNGEFKDEQAKERYHKANDAISYLDSLKSDNQLMIVEKMTDLARIISEIAPINQIATLNSKVESRIDVAIQTYKSSLFLPKISLTAITAVLTFLFAFPEKMEKLPFFSDINKDGSVSENHTFTVLWFVIMAHTGVLWIMASVIEDKEKRRLALLKTERVQNQVFKSFLSSTLYSDSQRSFVKSDLIDFILFSGKARNPSSALFGGNHITGEVAQSVAEVILEKAEKTGIIEKEPGKFLTEIFKLKEGFDLGQLNYQD